MWISAIAVTGLALASLYALRAFTPDPWTWDSAWINPDKIPRSRVLLGTDVYVCKVGRWNYMPTDSVATTYQEIVPIEMVDGKPHVIGGPVHPITAHTVDLTSVPHDVRGCRQKQDRLDTDLGVGWWGWVLTTKASSWGGLVRHSMTIIAPFEVTP